MAQEANPTATGVVDMRLDESVDSDPTEPVPLILEACTAAYGPELLAYLLGAGVDSPLGKWRMDGQMADGRYLDRLRTSFHILQTFKEPRRARSWLRDLNPRLDSRSPAALIRAGGRRDLDRVEAEAERAAELG